MKTKFNPTEISLIKHWLEDSCIQPAYITIYRKDRSHDASYILMVADSDKYSRMTILNKNEELFDTIALTHQLTNIFKAK